MLPGAGDISNFSVACPAQSACIAAGGFENDGPGAKTLTEQWQAGGTATAQSAPAALSPRAYRGVAGCIRAAMGESFADGAAATCHGPMINTPMPQRSRPASVIDRIVSLCRGGLTEQEVLARPSAVKVRLQPPQRGPFQPPSTQTPAHYFGR